jgi:RNA recognition motif-containing protein
MSIRHLPEISKPTRVCKLFVGNVDFGATDKELHDIFAEHGEVRFCKIILDQDTGRPKGFGFVHLATEDADAVIEQLNGYELRGRPIRVSIARERY